MDFKELTKRVDSKLGAIARKLDGRYTAFDDKDLYQQALVYLWEENRSGEFDDKTDSFILQGCFFFLKNYIRKLHKKLDRNSLSLNACLNDEGNSLEDFLPSITKDRVIAETEDRLLRENIYKVLNDRERVVFSWSLEEASSRQIARRLGLSHVMVGKIKQAIRNKCKPIISEIIVK